MRREESPVSVDVTRIQELAERVAERVERVLVGKPLAVQLALTAMLSHGHLLIEDNPGTLCRIRSW